MSAKASTTSKTRKTRSNGKSGNSKTTTATPKVAKVEGHGKPITLENGNVLYNDDRPAGKSGKGGIVVKHGTSTGYQRGCRCDECKAAMAGYTKDRREAGKSDEQKEQEKKDAAKAKAKATRDAKRAAKEVEEKAGKPADGTPGPKGLGNVVKTEQAA